MKILFSEMILYYKSIPLQWRKDYNRYQNKREKHDINTFTNQFHNRIVGDENMRKWPDEGSSFGFIPESLSIVSLNRLGYVKKEYMHFFNYIYSVNYDISYGVTDHISYAVLSGRQHHESVLKKLLLAVKQHIF
jgi:hypothetical protein